MSKYLDKTILYFEEIFLCFLFIAMPIVCLFQILCRHVFRFPIAWTEELMRALFVWATFIGASLAVKLKAHLGVTAIVNMFPRSVKRIAQFLIYAACMLFCVFLAYSGYKMVSFQTMVGQLLPVTRLPVALTTACMPVGFALMAIRLTLCAADEFKDFIDDAPDRNLLMEVAAVEAGQNMEEQNNGEKSK